MKIAIIDPLGGHGGLHYYVDGLATGLQKAGVETTVFTTGETAPSGREPYRVIIAFQGLFGNEPRVLRGLRFLRGMTKAVFSARKEGCQIAHFHSFHGNMLELFGVALARASGMQVVLTLHDIESLVRPGAAVGRRLMLQLSAAIIVHNAFSRDQLALVVRSYNTRNAVFVIPSGHYVAQFSDVPDRCKARAKLGLPHDKTIFLFFGNPRLEKGLDLLLRAMNVFSNESRVTLLVAGKMKPEQQVLYHKIIDEEGISSRLRIDAGHVSDEDIKSYYAAADLVVVPYRRVYDSAVTVMAMSFGRAVLVSNLPPLVEVTANGAYGLLFASEDTDDLSRALRQAFDGREALDQIGARAKDRVVTERSWDRIGAQTAMVYKRISEPHSEQD